jgi:ribosome biogenesis GTPase / thiamine phosphate phosphatase
MTGTIDTFGRTADIYRAWRDISTEGTVLARVVADFGTSLTIATPDMVTAELTGKLAHYTDPEHMPKVGDWVSARLSDTNNAVIEAVVPRRSEIARKAAGNRTVKQIIAANVDVAFVLLAIDDASSDFSVERLRRFLYQLSINNIKPVIVLNKADTASNIETYRQQLVSFDVPVIASDALSGLGFETVQSYILPGQTAILLGSSGVGKSTMTNRLLGREAQATQEVRTSDATGKHTTVHRQLFLLSNGGLLIDTPGIRELQLWGTQDDLDENYDDIAYLVSQCKYSTCKHGDEEGCAIRHALETGTLDRGRYAAYCKMRAELKTLKAKNVELKQTHNKKSHKSLRQQSKDAYREMHEDLNG